MTDAPTIERPRARKLRALRKLNAARRRRIEEAVERMIQALDEIDGDDDLEPSLGSSETHPSPGFYYTTNDRSDHQEGWSRGRRDDREEEHDGREPDVDDEPGVDNEPALGWTDEESAAGFNYAGALYGHEDEPSLGSVAVHELISQACWSQWCTGSDLEDEFDGCEPGEDEEPSLGAFDRMLNQTKSWRHAEIPGVHWDDAEHDPAEGREGDDERERDEAENGIGDGDGLDEQMGVNGCRAVE
jgi:hypothetical protein